MLDKVTTNETNIITRIEDELPKSTLYWFFISLVLAIAWTVFLAYYNSRAVAFVTTFILNKFVKYGHINVGSFSVSVLSGKIMFREVHYITDDFSARIEYGWIIFKWWRPYVAHAIGEDMSHEETRLYSFIDGFEFHVFNRSGTYEALEKLFGLLEVRPEDDVDEVTIDGDEKSDADVTATTTKKNSVTIAKNNRNWRDLIPVCKFDITTCRFVFGNSLVPQTLIAHLDDSHVTYTTTVATTPFDKFMHDLKVRSDSIRFMFVPSDGYHSDIVDEPPRMMGEGFVVLQSTDVKIHFIMDEPGVVPYEPEMVELADGETVMKRTFPSLNLDIQFGKNTDFNYGPWADRQREYLWKFFYPSDYQPLVPTKVAEAGERRQLKTFEFRMNIVAEATIDILYTKNSVTQAIHMNMCQGSYVEASIPWVTGETGYVSVFKGQLLLLEATTSMQFRSLLECETLDFNVTATYPIQWNAHQDWRYSFTACKATLYIIFEHKHFFGDLIEDWSTNSVPDVYHFVPYTYNINLLINQFELVTLCNEYNWIDTSSQHPENAQIAFCGEMFDLSLQLPWTDYLPVINSIGFIFKVENVFCRLYLPENNTSHHVIIALSENMKIVDRSGNLLEKPFCFDLTKQWRRATERSAGWVDCWMTSHVSLTITYAYHPMPPILKLDVHHLDPPPLDDYIGTPEMEEALLIPLRPMIPSLSKAPEDFDAGMMDSDLISVEFEVAPSVLCLYGSLLSNFLHVKENYLGEDQTYTDFYDTPRSSVEPKEPDGIIGPLTEREVAEKEFDERKYRPFAVVVSATLHDIQAHLVRNCNLESVPCPCVYVERVGFEMDKKYEETRLQVLISPGVLLVRDNVERDVDQSHLKEGHIALSGLQVRGNAMFSHCGLPLDSETLEYSWSVEAIIGDVTGKMSSPQIQNLVEYLQTFIMLVEDPENSLQRPVTYSLCQHMVPVPQCRRLQPRYAFPCPTSEDLKYKMTRVSVDSLNFYLVESGTALNVQVYPVRIATCNLHGSDTRSGITGLIENISLKQYISTAPLRHDTNQPEVWLESGGVSLGPINAEAAMALPNQDLHVLQDKFLKLHDGQTSRLWFLWPGDGIKVSSSVMGKCGCLGGCVFFGNNRNGVAFFHPKKHHEVTPTAVCKVSPEGMDPGFGQSMLHRNKLIFDLGTSETVSPTKEFSFTRGYMSTLGSPKSPDTPVTSITVVEECSSSSGTDIIPQALTVRHERGFVRSPTIETSSSSGFTKTPPSDILMTDNVLTNPFEPVRSPDSIRIGDLDPVSLDGVQAKSVGNVSIGSSQASSPAPLSGASRSSVARSPSSRSSAQSPSGRSSSHSTFSKYGSQYDATRQASIISLESEMYFSAEEGGLSSSDPHFPTVKDVHSSESESVTWGKNDSAHKLAADQSQLPSSERTVIERQGSLSSPTDSTLSYMSADTDPDDTLSGGIPDELSMVDLHGQVNKPITKSPVLLPCYSSHLTRLQCNDWTMPAPFPSRYHGVSADPSFHSLSSAGHSFQYSHSSASLPHFVKSKQGFSTRVMKAKDAMFSSMAEDGADPFSRDTPINITAMDSSTTMENASRTTATVKLNGSVDIFVTPLLLESFQRLCEAVTPTLTNLHPSAILDGLHSRCLDLLKSQNQLKKGQSSGDAETPDSDSTDDKDLAQKQFGGDKTDEIKTSSYQALFTLARVNICVLQAGMVEELISFSALDNIQELTCVSLLGVSLDGICCQLLSNSHSCKTTTSILPNILNDSPTSTKGRGDPQVDAEKENVSEVLREEDVGTVTLKAVHLQLRRLLKDSSYSGDIILTAIPEHKSKVMFSFESDTVKLFSPKSPRTPKVRRSVSGQERDYGKHAPFFRRSSHVGMDETEKEKKFLRRNTVAENPFDSAPQPKLLLAKTSRDETSHRKSVDESSHPRIKVKTGEPPIISYIMFECGLEDISITAVRRLGYKEKSDMIFHERLETVEKKAEEMQESARSKVEGQGQSSAHSQGHKTQTKDPVKRTVIVGSQEVYSSSNSIHSWDSRISIPSDASSLMDDEPLKGDASSGTLHLNMVWFNFAAPPPLPIHRKADFTKHDWNLLSTATPAINAWMNPYDRLMTAVRTLAQELTHRTNTVMACIMTEGLEVQSIHMPFKSKYQRITNFSKTLQEDASCQLLTVLRRYIHKVGTNPVELAVLSDTIPQLITVQKGILALTRQWKNVLYMPQLSQFSFKAKKHRPYTVQFAVTPTTIDNEDSASVNFDIVNENASLIDEDASIRPSESVGNVNRLAGPSRYLDVAPGMPTNGDGSALGSATRGKSTMNSRGQLQHKVFDSPDKPTNPHMTSLLRNDSTYSFQSASAMSVDVQTPPTTPYKGEATRPGVLRSKADGNADLYRWMAQQQEGFSSQTRLDEEPVTVRRQDSFLEAFGQGMGYEDSHTDVNMEHYTMGTSIMQLADAQNLFKPFLQSIGLHVENVRPTAMMKNFGGNLSLQGKMDVMKIQIAESARGRGRGKGKGKSRKYPKLIDTNSGAPAFLCELFTLNVSMRDIMDFDKKESETDEKFKNFPFKFAMHKLEAKPATLHVNLMLNCQSVTQNVDMPLLRLIHQFVTMIGNINETRIELKQGHSSVDWIRTHRKQDSKGSTSSASTQHSDMSRTAQKSDEPFLPKTNLTEIKTPDSTTKTPRTKSSFKIPFDTIRPERLDRFTSTVKKSHFKFSRDSKKSKHDRKSPSNNSADMMTPPQSLTLSDSVNIEMVETSSPSMAEKTFVDEIKASTPKCWRTLYHLLELYSTLPETKTISHRLDRAQLPVIEEEASEKANTSTPSGSLKARLDQIADEEVNIGGTASKAGGFESTPLARSTFNRTRFKQSIYIGDSVPLVVFGIAKLEKVKILAVLSGLKLEGEMRNVHASGTYKEKVKGFLQRKSSESSVTAHVGHTMIALLEGPSLQTVVTVNIAKSQGLHTTVMRRGKGHNSALVFIGAIDVDIPHHPVVLHGMLTRGTNQLSSTLQEFRRPISRTSRNVDLPEFGTMDSHGSNREPAVSAAPRRPRVDMQKSSTLHIHLKAVLQGITIGASLLPSLKAQYKTGPITITGVTVKKARFTVDLPNHTLSFKSKVTTMETFIPSSASIDLPPIHIYADYRHYGANAPVSEPLTEGLMLKEGNYLNAIAEVGMFEHSLTTDLLNHLVFVQKVFMKELNELLQKVSGSDKPVPVWPDSSDTNVKSDKDQILYSFHFRLKGIQITATTPTASAVRLETEAIDLEVSNRVQLTHQEADHHIGYGDNQKVFIKAQVNLNLALGQLIKNPMFEEADPEFQTMAFFKTKIGIRNALQDEMIHCVSTDQEALLITLTRPIILAQPMAFDKAVLVWLNYKNAYEYWTEQRLALNKEVQTATRQVIDRLPQITPSTQQVLSTLFLQLTVDDMGLCVPISPFNSFGQSRFVDNEPGAAVVITIESTQITACSSGSLVCQGKFTDFCLRMAEDFETSLDDWKPNPQDIPVMNACVVPEGTYEVCSRTINKQSAEPSSNAKWILNIKWDMEGIEIHIDTNIGKRLSVLGNTLTSLTGEADEEFGVGDETDGRLDVSLEDLPSVPSDMLARRPSAFVESLPKFIFDQTIDPKQRARMTEREMNEQAKIVQDLKALGASQTTIDTETRKLDELKGIIFHDFRREVLNRLKKQSEKASVLKDKLGIGSNVSHLRSTSVGGQFERNRESAPAEIMRLGKTMDPAQLRRPTLEVPDFGPSRVQFGETTSTTYTPPQTPDGTPQHKVPQRKTQSVCVPVSVRDIILVPSSSSSASTSSMSEDDSSEGEKLLNVFKGESSEADMSGKNADPKSQSNPSIGSGGSKSIVEPNVDFELDVKVFIDSGKFVLHPKETREEDGKRNKRDKSPASDPLGSPGTRRKMKKQDSTSSTGGQGKKPAPPQPPIIENTIFFLPGVDVKVHYNSKTDNTLASPNSTLPPDITGLDSADTTIKAAHESSPLADRATNMDSDVTLRSDTTLVRDTTLDQDATLGRDSTLGREDSSGSRDSTLAGSERDSCTSTGTLKKMGVKKASLYAWLSLQSLPEEMVISPCLLDFLEQALEPIPISMSSQSKKDNPVIDSVLDMDLNASYASIGTPTFLGSFPVDVMVFIRVEPSIIRFNCHPISRVECLLQVPSLELVFSTNRSEVNSSPQSADGTPPLKKKVNLKPARVRNLSGEQARLRTGSSVSDLGTHLSSSGGLSVTGSLSDFSLYIFHPYGGGQRKQGTGGTPVGRYLGSIQEQTVLSDVARKDSLSLNLEFLNLNISRSRKLDMPDRVEMCKSNRVRFSAVCDIGSAAFKYDMRRLSEILSFPKAWYRRNLARRVFLGDESGVVQDSDSSSCSSATSSLGGLDSSGLFPPYMFKPFTSSPTLHVHTLGDFDGQGHHRRGSSGDKVKIQISPDFKNELADRLSAAKTSPGFSVPMSPTDNAHMNLSDSHHSGVRQVTKSATNRRNSQQLQRSASRANSERKATGWETLVVFAVNLSRLDVNVNMSNVMGNTSLTMTAIKSQGRLSIDSSGHKDLKITAGLGASHFDSRGGVVGGNVDLQDITTVFEVSEDPRLGKDPIHRGGLGMYALEGRVDYMGSSILMTRLSDMQLSLRDEWKIEQCDADAPLATKRSALLFAHGDLGWDKFHILISRSTTPDLIKIGSKLEEFIMQQFTSSRRALGAIGSLSASSRLKMAEKRRSGDDESFMSELRHHRHWQKALGNITGCHFSMLPSMLPKDGMILGGTVTLRGNNLSLACFNGINFKSKAWAIFTMNEPYICFATEAQKTQDEGTHIVQDLTFYVNHDLTTHTQDKHMAYILKLSRGHSMPPTFTSAHEWFQYAFATTAVKDLDSFPRIQRTGSDSPSDSRKRKYTDYNHETEVIFALPSMQLQLRSKHFQDDHMPLEDEPKPVVECTFVTEFEDHIYVAMDAELILFIHDLVSLYIREKDKGMRTSVGGSSSKTSKTATEPDKKKLADPITVLQQDWREYECKTWHLEPTVRLLHWASKQIDPVGVDYILQKLGFSHARVTIPKWMQRGFMDPSDKILSMLVNKLITVLRDTPGQVEQLKSTPGAGGQAEKL